MADLKCHSAGFTDIGIGRDKNDDAFFLDDKMCVYAVADGLGGLPDGDIASKMAVSALPKTFELNRVDDSPPDWDVIFSDINKEIYDEGKRLYPEYGIATTLTTFFYQDNIASIGHVGDSGIFLFREGEVFKLTRDHTVAEEIWNSISEEKRKYTSIPEHLYHTLTRCLGQKDSIEIDFLEHDIQAGDKFLLYSDGITKTMSDKRIGMLLEVYDNPEQLLLEVKKIAYEKDAPDNLTAIALFFT